MGRHMFFGGNTPNGFYSKFEDILFLKEAKKMIYLKGSSGSGKSTLMRKVASAFEKEGVEVDYIHCSNNVNDLDGICIRERGIAMVDATAPHICDPVLPIAVDEIFNLADFIDRDYIQKYDQELLKLQIQKKPYYQKAYKYLNAAYQIYENNTYIYAQSLNHEKLREKLEEEVSSFYSEPVAKSKGLNRSFLVSAISPQGTISYLNTLVKGKKIIGLKGKQGMGINQILTALRDIANSRGYYTESCLSTLDTGILDHLIIPDKNLAYITLNQYHTVQEPVDRIIDFIDFCDQNQILEKKEEIEYNQSMFQELLQKSMEMMDAQKEVHDQIEKIYIGGMDFVGLDQAFYTIMDIIHKAREKE